MTERQELESQISWMEEDLRNLRKQLVKMKGFKRTDIKFETVIVPTLEFLKDYGYKLEGPDYGIYKLYKNRKYEYEGSKQDCFDYFLKIMEYHDK